MNKKILYKSIMKSISKLIKKVINETIDFNTSNIFNKEESFYNYNEKDSLIYRTIEDKILNDKLITKKESIYYFKTNNCIPEFILNKLMNGEKISKRLLEGISIANVKYKVNSKKELKNIIVNYTIKNKKGSLNWIDTSLITDMSELFYFLDFNGDISEWDTSNVTNMSKMFFHSEFFNKSIENWDVSNVKDMHYMFCAAYKFNQDIEKWKVNKVVDMRFMFAFTYSFNQPIGNWDVSNVENMDSMFYMAKKFNLNISKWELKQNAKITDMFYNCPIIKEYKPKLVN